MRPHWQRPRLWPCASFLSEVGHLLGPLAASHSPCPVRSCLCTVALAPLLWAPSKPGKVLRRHRGQGERIWRSERSSSLLRCFKDRICASEASPSLKPPGCCVGAREQGWGGTGRRHSHQKAWKKDSTKAVGRSLGPESELCWKAWDGSPCL